MLPLLYTAVSAFAQAPLNDVVSVVVGADAACALRRDHTLHCWGERFGPLAVPVATDVAAVASPECWVHRDGRLSCKSTSESTSKSTRGSPTAGFPQGMASLSFQEDAFVCGHSSNGHLWCGGEWAVALGGPRGIDPSVPTRVAEIEDVIAVAPVGACVLQQGGAVRCFGPKGPTLVEGLPPIRRFVSDTRTAVMDEDGQVWNWSTPTSPRVRAPSTVPAGVAQESLTAGSHRNLNCALTTDGGVVCWGTLAARWWAGARAAWEVAPMEEGRSGRQRFEDDADLVGQALCERTEAGALRCEPETLFGSPTAPVLVFDDLTDVVYGHHAGCGRSGKDVLCFGGLWLARTTDGQIGVVRFVDVVDFWLSRGSVTLVEAAGRVRNFSAGIEMPSFSLPGAAEVHGVEEMACVRSAVTGEGGGKVFCWEIDGSPIPHPVAFDHPVSSLGDDEDTVCFPEWDACVERLPSSLIPVSVEMAP